MCCHVASYVMASLYVRITYICDIVTSFSMGLAAYSPYTSALRVLSKIGFYA